MFEPESPHHAGTIPWAGGLPSLGPGTYIQLHRWNHSENCTMHLKASKSLLFIAAMGHHHAEVQNPKVFTFLTQTSWLERQIPREQTKQLYCSSKKQNVKVAIQHQYRLAPWKKSKITNSHHPELSPWCSKAKHVLQLICCGNIIQTLRSFD